MRWNRAKYDKTQRNAKIGKKKCLDSCKTIQYQTNSKQSQRNKPKWHETEQNATNAHKSAELLQKTKKTKNAVGRAKNNRGQPGSNRGQPGSNRGQPGKTSKTYNLLKIRSFSCIQNTQLESQIVQTRPNCSNLSSFGLFGPVWTCLGLFRTVSTSLDLFHPKFANYH